MRKLCKGCQIEIFQDEWAESPREWGNLGTMICKHRRYSLGDVEMSGDYKRLGCSVEEDMANFFYDKEFPKCYESSRYVCPDGYLTERGVEAVSKWVEENIVVLPLYLYDHGGITMNTTGFSCPWDSGQVGFIYVSKEKACREYGWKRLTKERIEQIKEFLRGEVEVYDQYLRGEVYISKVYSPDGEFIESCFGFYGDPEGHLMNEAKKAVDYYWDSKRREWWQVLKSFIKSKAPLEVRQRVLSDNYARS